MRHYPEVLLFVDCVAYLLNQFKTSVSDHIDISHLIYFANQLIEVVVRRCSSKYLILKISQISQEKIIRK